MNDIREVMRKQEELMDQLDDLSRTQVQLLNIALLPVLAQLSRVCDALDACLIKIKPKDGKPFTAITVERAVDIIDRGGFQEDKDGQA